MRLAFEVTCAHCPGNGIIRPARPGIDWPTACPCGGRRTFTQYQLGRLLGEDPRAIERVAEMRARHDVCLRVFRKLAKADLRAFQADA